MSDGMKENCTPGKRRASSMPQVVDVLRGRLVVLGERDQHVGVLRADRRRVAVRQIQAAVGQPDVVDDALDLRLRDDVADGRVDGVAQRRRLLDPRAGRRPQVQLELAAVDRREEILADPREQRERHAADAAGSRSRRRPRLRQAAARASSDRRRAGARSRRRAPRWMRTNGLRDTRRARAARAPSAGTSPSSAPASATARRTRASRTPPLRPSARTDSAPRRSGRTSARTRCRCRASRRTPAWRSARRRRGSPARAPCPARGAS